MSQVEKPFVLFLVIWIGQLLSRIGSGVSAFALGVFLFQKTGSASAYSFLLLAAFLPSVLLAPLGGVIADRRDRKLMMVVGDLGAAIGIIFVIVMYLLYPDKHWPIYLGLAISSLFGALHSPAFKSSVTDLLDEQAYAKASGLIQLAEASRYILAPVIAALLLARFSLPLVLLIDVITFILAALTVVVIRKIAVQSHAECAHESLGGNFTAGLQYMRHHPIILRLLCLTAMITFFTGILQALLAPIILSFTNASTLGTILSIAASGMLVSSLCIGMLSNTHGQERVLALSLVATGLFYLLIGVTTSTVFITCTAFCFFFTLPFVNTSLEVLFRQQIDNAMQGRIWSLISLISQAGMLIAFGIAGVLADHVFNPLLTDTGSLANTVGRIIGTGAARGSGLLVLISGILFFAISTVIAVKGRHSNAADLNPAPIPY